MDIQEEKKGQVVIVKVSGRLDSNNSSELEQKISGLIDKNEKMILVDCQCLNYVSSSGLRVFLMGLKKMNTVQGKFMVCSLQDMVKDVFDISGFTSIFPLFDSQSEALNAV